MSGFSGSLPKHEGASNAPSSFSSPSDTHSQAQERPTPSQQQQQQQQRRSRAADSTDTFGTFGHHEAAPSTLARSVSDESTRQSHRRSGAPFQPWPSVPMNSNSGGLVREIEDPAERELAQLQIENDSDDYDGASIILFLLGLKN